MSERVTRALVRDVPLDGLGTLALVTLDNGEDHRVPNTLGSEGMAALHDAFSGLRQRADAGEIVAVGITGKPFHFAAGADLRQAATTQSKEDGLDVARSGHDAYRILLDMPVPTFAYVSGVALGGGLELALSCSYRTVASSVRNIGLPEVAIGLIPGWGGSYLLPQLVGIEKAIQVVLTNPLRNNTQLTSGQAIELGIMDAEFSPADFLAESLRWTARVLRGEQEVPRAQIEGEEFWHGALAEAATQVEERLHGAAPAALEAIKLLQLAESGDREKSFAAEDEALSELIISPQFDASIHAFNLTSSRARKPVGAPPADNARPVTKVGVIGAGLMASQLALLFARQMKVPVVMRDLDEERAQRGLGFVKAEVDKLQQRGRLTEAAANRILALVSATTDISELAQADFIIEAVFEEMEAKKTVLGELAPLVAPETIFATNTSALSVTEMARDLPHPQRMVGLHFFNPVAQMPLVEVVRTPETDDTTYATAFAVAKGCRKTAVGVADRPGFIVNRLLVRLLGEVLGALEDGTSVADADAALRPLGLPMGPFQLLQLVGPAVAQHVLDTLRDNLGDRYPTTPGLAKMVETDTPFVVYDRRPSAASPVNSAIAEFFGSRSGNAHTPEELLARVRDALAEEVRYMLDEGVATDGDDIDLAMIMGAGWPFHLGGIIPYLKRTGALAQ